MTSDDIKKTIVEALTRIAPEIDPASIETSTSFRDQLDLDSMDFLNFVLALHDRLGIDIPETDYPRLYSLGSAISYLSSKSIAGPTSSAARESTKPGSSAGV